MWEEDLLRFSFCTLYSQNSSFQTHGCFWNKKFTIPKGNLWLHLWVDGVVGNVESLAAPEVVVGRHGGGPLPLHRLGEQDVLALDEPARQCKEWRQKIRNRLLIGNAKWIISHITSVRKTSEKKEKDFMLVMGEKNVTIKIAVAARI